MHHCNLRIDRIWPKVVHKPFNVRYLYVGIAELANNADRTHVLGGKLCRCDIQQSNVPVEPIYHGKGNVE
jgi:hypothetical protein